MVRNNLSHISIQQIVVVLLMALFNELTDLLLIVNIIFGLFLTQFVNISHISVAVAISQTADVLGEIPVKTAVLYQGPQILRLE